MDLAVLLSTDSSETDMNQGQRFIATFDSIFEEIRCYYEDLKKNKHRAWRSVPAVKDLLKQILQSSMELRFYDIRRATRSLLACIDANACPDYEYIDTEIIRQEIVGLCCTLLCQRSHYKRNGVTRSFHESQQRIGEHSNDLIYALTLNPESRNSLGRQFDGYGFHIRSFRSRAQLEINAAQAEPAAIILDGQLPDGPKLITAMREQVGKAPKIIYLSTKNTFEEHVQVRHAGADHYLTKPVKKATLLECLNQATGHIVVPSAKVLIVSDQPTRRASYENTLSGIGLEVCVLSEPLNVLEPLTELRPDLLLIDLSDLEFSGKALGETLRHYDPGTTLPIVYVGAPYQYRLTSTDVGSEDYVEAHCDERYLTELIISRIRRTQFLNALISRDPLTGFWTEDAFSERFDTVLGLAMRTRDALSAIVLDIDRFREINRCTGYITGNAVLRSIAGCIIERMRYSDVIGRYGPGRIALALPGADLQAAREVANDLGRQIGALKHTTGTTRFSVTVSMGIAGYRFDSRSRELPLSAVQLVESANKALEEGKRRGHAFIEIYDSRSSGSTRRG